MAGKPRQNNDHISDADRLIDVRSFQHQIVGEHSDALVSARMNSIPFPAHEQCGCGLSVYALDADAVPESAIGVEMQFTKNSTAMARSMRTILDADPLQWQHLSAELQLPSNIAYLVIRLHITQAFDANGKSPFNGAYVDDVTLSLRRWISLL